MIGSLEKGMAAAQITLPPQGSYEGVDLGVLPRYICFRAALLHNKLTQQYIILGLGVFLAIQFIVYRIEINSLYVKLREKEYILAPGVQDFTPANPKSVSENYIRDVVSDLLNKLGNVSASNIDSQYGMLSALMSPQLNVKFNAEAAEFKAKVKADNISEMINVTQQEIQPSDDGFYKVVVLARRETYINNEYVGHSDEAIEMVLQLVAPKRDRPWYVQINSLSRQSAETFRSKNKY